MIPAAQITAFFDLKRRALLNICAAGISGAAIVPLRAFAQAAALSHAAREIIGSAVIVDSGLLLSMPLLAENGNAVPVTLKLDGALVQRWLLIAEKNPRPLIFDIRMGLPSAQSSLTTRIRLGASQSVQAYAQTTGGVWHRASADIALTASACYDGT